MLRLAPEANEFARSLAGAMEEAWGAATSAPSGDLSEVLAITVRQGALGLGAAGAIDALAAAMTVLGERACPLPLHDAYAVCPLVDEVWSEQIELGGVLPLLVFGDAAQTEVSAIEGAAQATHVVVVDERTYEVVIRPIRDRAPQSGLAIPDWHRLELGEVVGRFARTSIEVREAATVVGLGLAVRALAAARRAHHLAVEHAKVRWQFGRLIGGFGAVQQRIAAAEIEIEAGSSVLSDAITSYVAGDAQAPLSAALAVRFVADMSTGVMFAAQHTLGAIGYFEEHEAAWLFRRVQADSLLLRQAQKHMRSIAEALIDDGEVLPTFALGDAADAFRSEIRQLLDGQRLADGTFDIEALRAAATASGLFAMRWPAQYGGRDATIEEMAVLTEEMKRAGGPVDRAMSASTMLGHSILRHGTPEQQAQFLPLIREGRMAFCLGYSEPEAGSDLASLRTSAVRDGGDWIVNGQKLWTTRANTATHVWLAVRTDPDAEPRHAGITIFLVPMDTPGITVSDHVALSGEISCTVFYDDVRVPDTARVGEVNGGWGVITGALSSERLIMGGVAGALLRQCDVLVDELRLLNGEIGLDQLSRDRLNGLAARLQAARSLVLAGMLAKDDKEARRLAPMAAVLSGEFAEEFGQSAIELLGPRGALGTDGPGGGIFEAALRLAPMYVIGGGTNDIQRGLIARALGLARE